jgi:hypothetical protein
MIDLFDGSEDSLRKWHGDGFHLEGGELLSTGNDMRLLWYPESFADFALHLEFRIFDAVHHNSGVFVRFPDNPADPIWGAVRDGFEIQIDDVARGDQHKDFYGIYPEPDGLYKNRTGAIYKIPAGDRIWHEGRNDVALQHYTPGPPLVPGKWHAFDITVTGDDYAVWLDGKPTTRFTNTDPGRGRSPGLVGIQSYPGSTVAWRKISARRLA